MESAGSTPETREQAPKLVLRHSPFFAWMINVVLALAAIVMLSRGRFEGDLRALIPFMLLLASEVLAVANRRLEVEGESIRYYDRFGRLLHKTTIERVHALKLDADCDNGSTMLIYNGGRMDLGFLKDVSALGKLLKNRPRISVALSACKTEGLLPLAGALQIKDQLTAG